MSQPQEYLHLLSRFGGINLQSASSAQRHVEGNYPETDVPSILEGLFQRGIPEVNVEGRDFALTSLDAVYEAVNYARDSAAHRRW